MSTQRAIDEDGMGQSLPIDASEGDMPVDRFDTY
jgi:hypothetical protein